MKLETCCDPQISNFKISFFSPSIYGFFNHDLLIIIFHMKKNILITGASGNLGKATVEKFLKEGHRVIALISPGKSLGFDFKGDLVVEEANLTDESSTTVIIDKIVVENKSIDVALLLVGGYASGSVFETDGTQLKKMYSQNFETAYFVARPVFSQMSKQASGGRIIFIGARPAMLAKDGKSSLAYALSKSLIFKLADFLNAEGSGKNVLCSVIVPSTIDTPVNRAAMPAADFSSWVKPEAIAEVMSFVASDAAGTLRDTVLKVYGTA